MAQHLQVVRSLVWISVVLVVAQTSALAARGRFAAAVNYSAGITLPSVAVGDFNGDHILDLAVADGLGDSVSVLLGNGDGTFQAPVRDTLGGCIIPAGVATGDFNGDGKLDLAVVGPSLCLPGGVDILLGNGDGTFQAPMVFSAGHDNNFVAVADFNGDGKLDLAVAAENLIAVLLGNGDGTFQMAPSTVGGGFLTTLAVGDFNRDGKPDLAFVESQLEVALGNGDGTFQSPAFYNVGSFPYGVATGDFNRDGVPDLAVTNNVDGTVSVLLGNGDGTFQKATNYSAGSAPWFVAVSDFDRDGKPDLAVTNNSSGGDISVLLGNGDGTFQNPTSYGVVSFPTSLALADFNEDGAVDLVAASDSGGDVSVLLNQGGTFVAASSSPNPSHSGQTVTFTATTTASLAGLSVPTGSVTFMAGRIKLGTARLVNGQASISTSRLPAGIHRITLFYSGDTNFNPNQAPPIAQGVLP